ncbi:MULTISPECIES: hypothetical protein [Streptomyces]|uniref:hypothetical protein n=1 Tax=Streptomyces TaxID=1883 RepID=UPI0002ED69AF|nr:MULTISPECIES: hypothetical protein [Streptomyces]AZK93768.1 hypothetical protein B7R87_07680 [Streptomyces tsukubensis]
MRTPKTTGAVPKALVVLAVVALGPLTACGPGDDGDGRGGRGGSPTPPPVATGTLEQLAARAGCAPEIRAGAEELRQARCATEDGTYTLVTFATDRGQREWINAANDYGGTYLLGRRWVVAGGEGTITALRARLGGELERGADHGSGTVRPGPGEGHSSPGSPGSHGVHGGHGG